MFFASLLIVLSAGESGRSVVWTDERLDVFDEALRALNEARAALPLPDPVDDARGLEKRIDCTECRRAVSGTCMPKCVDVEYCLGCAYQAGIGYRGACSTGGVCVTGASRVPTPVPTPNPTPKPTTPPTPSPPPTPPPAPTMGFGTNYYQSSTTTVDTAPRTLTASLVCGTADDGSDLYVDRCGQCGGNNLCVDSAVGDGRGFSDALSTVGIALLVLSGVGALIVVYMWRSRPREAGDGGERGRKGTNDSARASFRSTATATVAAPVDYGGAAGGTIGYAPTTYAAAGPGTTLSGYPGY